ncbi:MAG TPA: hypothetical protein VIS09_04775 [Streptomyces sp.]
MRSTVVRGRGYDVARHQQAAMPEQLLATPAADPEHDDQEPVAGPQEAIDMKAHRPQESAPHRGARRPADECRVR